jgi:hypothetical protein
MTTNMTTNDIFNFYQLIRIDEEKITCHLYQDEFLFKFFTAFLLNSFYYILLASESQYHFFIQLLLAHH